MGGRLSTLSALVSAVVALADPLKKSAATPGPFSYVGQWLGEVRQLPGGGVTVEREAVGRNPALLVAIDSERASRDIETLAGDAEVRGDVSIILWLVLRDPRGAALATNGGTGQPGLLTLLDAVIATFNGASLASGGSNLLLRDHRLRYDGFQLRPVDANIAVVASLHFTAERSVATVTATESTENYVGTTGREHLQGTEDAVPPSLDPLVTFRDA